MKSLDCAAPFGMVVVFGAASGPAPAIEPELLNKKGCLFYQQKFPLLEYYTDKAKR